MTDKYFDELKQWKLNVGKAILGFGEIELITLKCLEKIPNDNIYKSTSSLPLGKRLDLIIDILTPREEEVIVGRILVMLRRAKELTGLRNLLAHNPLMANVFEHQHTGDYEVEMLISKIRGGEVAVDLEYLKILADEVERLASDLWMQFDELMDDG